MASSASLPPPNRSEQAGLNPFVAFVDPAAGAVQAPAPAAVPAAVAAQEGPVAILGAGLAGLTAAVHLKRHGIPFVVYEGADAVAGLCQSERDEEGFTYDCGVHFITNRLAAAVGIASECRPMLRYGEAVHLGGRSYSYPWGLMASPRFLASALWGWLRRWGEAPAATAQAHYRQQYGRALADAVAAPLTAAWSGLPVERLAASVSQKFATGLPRMLMLKLSAALSRRTVGIGYSRVVTESANAWHVYPEGGIARVCQRLADEVADSIVLRAKVEAIEVRDDRVEGVRVNGALVPVSGVISTAPVHALVKLVQGSDRLQPLARLRYRAMVSVNLKLVGASGLRDVVTWVPEERYPFFRVSDVGFGLPWLVPEGKDQVTCDIGCQIGDETWRADDAALVERCIAGLDEMLPGLRSRVIGSRVMRVPLAYPIFELAYEPERERFERQGTGIGGLVSVGRNGEFSHLLMEDVYWRTRWKVSEFITARQAAR